MTYTNGCHVCELAVERETGRVEILRYVVVDDAGLLVNRQIAAGQVHGATAQGIGQALLEEVVYDKESGQLLTGSLLDYCLPRADDLPAFQVTFAETTPAETNPLGAKGIGEVGAIAAPPAVMNALIDALTPLGIHHLDMPATPEKIWRAMRDAQS